MSHSIVTDICEGVADCVAACPVACIDQGPAKNYKGTDWSWIDFSTCIDCGIVFRFVPWKALLSMKNDPIFSVLLAYISKPL